MIQEIIAENRNLEQALAKHDCRTAAGKMKGPTGAEFLLPSF